MLNFYTNLETGSFVVWPESGSSTLTSSINEYSMQLVDDLDLTSGSFDVYKINNPTKLSEYLVLQYYSGSFPSSSGQYTYTLFQDVDTAYKWIEANFTYLSTNGTWGGEQSGGTNAIDSGRAFVFGTNDPEFTKYISPNESGSYITYYTG
jgi:hypothetical protein